ncbi:MAG: cupredoxin domain-containing protein [Pelagibacteraceae bacterium]
MKKLILLFIFIPNILFAGSMKAIGVKGQEENIDRVIKVSMYDNYYQPNSFKIKKNETIKFVVENKGQLVHEFNIATKEMHLKHQPEMMMMVEHEILLADKIDKKKMKEMSKKNPTMAHSHSNSVLLSPGEKAELIWKFSNTVDIEAACNVPGHYDVGMKAKIDNI